MNNLVEQQTEWIINNILVNKGWIVDNTGILSRKANQISSEESLVTRRISQTIAASKSDNARCGFLGPERLSFVELLLRHLITVFISNPYFSAKIHLFLWIVGALFLFLESFWHLRGV